MKEILSVLKFRRQRPIGAFLLLLMLTKIVYADVSLLTRKQALIIAESTKEVELLYKLHKGRLENCIDKEVVKPCESGWVTCIDNAWVVQFTISDICQIEHDGRLGLTILIDAVTGRIISRYPEAEYFEQESYCLDDSDCACDQSVPEQMICSNFIFSQVKGNADLSCELCRCSKNKCVLNNE
ncbi:MAG: hypothetical protein AB7S78_10215 [Candidatus Omnitrophota bacterium]